MFTAIACRAAWRRLGCAIGITLAATGTPAADMLGLEQALRLASERSRLLAAQDSAAAAARDMAVSAGQLPDPVLKAGINNLPTDGADRFSLTRDFMTMRSISVMQELTREGKRRARSARYEREAEVAEAARGAALADLRRDTATAWFERHYLERMLALLREQRAEAALQVDAADAAYRSGRGMQAEAFAARSAVALIDDRLQQTERELANAAVRLARWVGDAAGQPLAAPPDMAAPHDAHALDDRLARHPQLALMARQEEVARAEAEVARANRQPDWSVELMVSQRGPAYSNMVSLGVSIPLPWDRANRQDRELAARLALAEQLRAERDEAAREHQAETRSWLQSWQGNRERLAHYDRALIPLAAERTHAALAAYRGGGGPLSAVLDARRMEIDTRMDRLRLEMETAALWARLEYLLPADTGAATRTTER